MNDFSSQGIQFSLKPHLPYGIYIWIFGPLYYLLDPYACGNPEQAFDVVSEDLTKFFWYLCQLPNKFLASLSWKVRFSVRIDILAKEKFANLSKKFIFFSYFYLFLICILYTSFFFLLFCNFLLGAKHNVKRKDG